MKVEKNQDHIYCKLALSPTRPTMILLLQKVQIKTLVVFVEETETLQSTGVRSGCVEGRM